METKSGAEISCVFKDNDLIFAQGDVGDSAYLVERGRVLIFLIKDKEEFPISILGEGEIFGEMALIDNSTRSASARAVGEVLLTVVTKEQLFERIQSADTVVQLLMGMLLKRLRRQNEYLLGLNKIELKMEDTHSDHPEAVERIKLENKIFKAFKAGELVPYYQPIVDLHTREIKGCEALVRWISPSETISPSIFMEVVENSSMVLPIGRWIIEKVFSDLERILHHAPHPEDFFASINISGRQFEDKDFISHLEISRHQIGLPAGAVKLELTERVMTRGQMALESLTRCRGLGYKIAIDDFGTGFSSLQYLASMPLHDLKIDRSFVCRMHEDPHAMSLIKSLVFLAQSLNLGIIAEGIETNEDLKAISSLGIPLGQGYLFSKAVPLDQFLPLLLDGSAPSKSRVA